MLLFRMSVIVADHFINLLTSCILTYHRHFYTAITYFPSLEVTDKKWSLQAHAHTQKNASRSLLTGIEPATF